MAKFAATEALQKTLDLFKRVDRQHCDSIFAEELNPSDFDGYAELVPQPIDLPTIL